MQITPEGVVTAVLNDSGTANEVDEEGTDFYRIPNASMKGTYAPLHAWHIVPPRNLTLNFSVVVTTRTRTETPMQRFFFAAGYIVSIDGTTMPLQLAQIFKSLFLVCS